MKFKNKVVIVTGGASGIGFALCSELSKRGAKVILADIDSEGGVKGAETINKNAGLVIPVCVDATKETEITNLIRSTINEYGKLDYIFNNAGIGGDMDFRNVTIEHWKRMVDLNLWSVIYGTTAAYKVMVEQGFGHIINTASISGLIPTPAKVLYNTTKAAVILLSTTLRYEAAEFGIKVSVVCPGAVKSRIWGTPILGKRDQDGTYLIPPEAISAEKAANIILKGIVHNKEKIVFPFLMRFVFWLYRIHPSILNLPFRKIVRESLSSNK